jgi:hypothetical protein
MSIIKLFGKTIVLIVCGVIMAVAGLIGGIGRVFNEIGKCLLKLGDKILDGIIEKEEKPKANIDIPL